MKDGKIKTMSLGVVVVILVLAMLLPLTLGGNPYGVSETTVGNGLKNVQWWLDIYVYSSLIDENGTFQGYRPATNATIILYGINYTEDGSDLIPIGGSMLTTEGENGTLKVHIDFNLTIPEDNNVLEVLALGYWLTEPINNTDLNLTNQSLLLWAPIYYSIF